MFGPLAKKIGRFVKTAFFFFDRNILVRKLTLFIFVWSLNRLFSKLCLKSWGKSVRTALYLARGAICRKQVFIGRLIVCSLFSDFYRKAFGLSANKSTGCQNFILLHRNILRKKFLIIMFFWSLNGFFSKFWQKTWGKSVGTALYVARQAIRGKQMVLGRLIVCLFFGFLVDSFWAVGK